MEKKSSKKPPFIEQLPAELGDPGYSKLSFIPRTDQSIPVPALVYCLKSNTPTSGNTKHAGLD